MVKRREQRSPNRVIRETLAVIMALPGDSPVTFPSPETVATSGVSLLQLTTAFGTTLPSWSSTLTSNCSNVSCLMATTSASFGLSEVSGNPGRWSCSRVV